MSSFVAATIVVLGAAAWVGLAIGTLAAYTEEKRRLALVLAIVWLVMTIGVTGLVLDHTRKQNAVGPCLEWTTGTAYNAATKTMMTYRRCVERGEWVTE